MIRAILLMLLLTAHALDIQCDAQGYLSYLEAYPIKCDGKCDAAQKYEYLHAYFIL